MQGEKDVRIGTSLIIISIIILAFVPSGRAAPNISAHNAILIEEISGRVLFEKEAYEKQSIASITKVMTAIIAIEQGNLQHKVKTSRRAIMAEGSSIYLELGEQMTLEDLLYGLMLRSGNDAAISIAEHIGGSVEGFVYLMNEKAKQLGMTKTNFMNPHGLHDDDHYSTAYDMALLLRYAMQNDDFQTISKTRFHKPTSRSYGWKNKHRLVNGMYRYSTGGKTGFTRRSGRTLMTTAKQDDLSLIAVTLNGPDDWNDHIQLFNWGFKTFQLEKLLSKGKVTYPVKSQNDILIGYIYDDVYYPVRDKEIDEINKHSYLLKTENKRDSIIGKTVLKLNDHLIAHVDIYAHDEQSKRANKINFYDIALKISGLDNNG